MTLLLLVYTIVWATASRQSATLSLQNYFRLLCVFVRISVDNRQPSGMEISCVQQFLSCAARFPRRYYHWRI